MKKTALILGGLISLSLVATTFAQTTTNVYSQNAVGYMNITLQTSFSLLTAQLVDSSGQPLSIGQMFPSPQDGMTVYVFQTNTQTYSEYIYVDGMGWLDSELNDASARQLNRGIGFWAYVPTPTNMTVVGEVPGSASGTTTLLSLANGLTLVAYPYPVARTLSQMQLGLTPTDSDTVYIWTGAGYGEYIYVDGMGWLDGSGPADPTVQPGIGFWYYNAAAAKQVSETKPYLWP